MNRPITSCSLAAATFFGMAGAVGAWQPGTYPAGTEPMISRGFIVDTSNRNDVLSFWHGVYQASEGYASRIAWTGNYSGSNGTISNAFVRDVERRINFFRAMTGVNASVLLNSGSPVVINSGDAYKPEATTTKSAAAQSAALMLIRNYNSSTGEDKALTHNPANNLIGWSAAAWNGCANGNFAFGLYGPGAITEYMAEELTNASATANTSVGHRRWCLFPRATDFATGDQPGKSAYQPGTSVLYVMQAPAELATVTPKFFTYPSAGFFPAPVNTRFWSVSRQGADFSTATISMTTSTGSALSVSGIVRNGGFGDPALVWQVPAAASVKTVTSDTTFNVTISGIKGTDVPSTFSYSVTLVDPNRITSDMNITGPASVGAGKTGTFNFGRPSSTEALRVVAGKVNTTTWKADAEDATKPLVIDGTSKTYALLSNPASFSGFGALVGSKAFRLTFPTSYDLVTRGVPQQSFELDRDILQKSGLTAAVEFKYRRGYMTTGSKLAVEATSDDGVTWTQIGLISGTSNSSVGSLSTATYNLPKSTEPQRIRFRYYSTGGSIYPDDSYKTYPTGIFIDEIKTKNCDWLEEKKVNTMAEADRSIEFSAATAGATLTSGDSWRLRLGVKMGNRWFGKGPSKIVPITAQ